MGCSRLGSLLARGNGLNARAAVAAALDEGITLFDTANIYGQGSSEMILGSTLPRDGVEICTKGGFVPPVPLWVLRTMKQALRPIARRNVGGMRQRASSLRAKSYPQRFDPASLARSLNGSLTRLRRERTDIFLLHNPPVTFAASQELWRWVEAEIQRGRIAAFGISCAGCAADVAWLDNTLLSVVQLPASSIVPTPGGFLADARTGRLRIMVREIVGPGHHTPDAIAAGLAAVVSAPSADVAVLGMSSPAHVREANIMFQAALGKLSSREGAG